VHLTNAVTNLGSISTIPTDQNTLVTITNRSSRQNLRNPLLTDTQKKTKSAPQTKLYLCEFDEHIAITKLNPKKMKIDQTSEPRNSTCKDLTATGPRSGKEAACSAFTSAAQRPRTQGSVPTCARGTNREGEKRRQRPYTSGHGWWCRGRRAARAGCRGRFRGRWRSGRLRRCSAMGVKKQAIANKCSSMTR